MFLLTLQDNIAGVGKHKTLPLNEVITETSNNSHLFLWHSEE